MKIRFRLYTLALLLPAACSVGTTGKNYAPGKSPAGASVMLELSGGRRTLSGELLAVEDSSLVVQSGGQLHRIPLRLIQSGKAPKLSFSGAGLKPPDREQLRLISRYPQGVSPELERRLLEAYGQTAVEEAT
jgi:hypothetical protein